MRNIIKTFNLIRYAGLGFCLFRARYFLRRKSGLLKLKCPARQWNHIDLADFIETDLANDLLNLPRVQQSNGRRFFFESNKLPQADEDAGQKAVADAEEILQNKFRYFWHKSYSLGEGPDWFLNPANNGRAANQLHWTDVKTFDPAVGDIKFIWEPSRFGWVYALVRAFAATGDNKYAEKFWALFESWLGANQPNTGPNYACGQECSIRLMAMCFALYAFGVAGSATDERKIKLITAIAVHAERIEKNIDFAVSTKTNHSITESVGLYTVGLLFPEFKRSAKWRRLGKKIFTNEVLKQISCDGSYIQQSMNYHRLMLQDCLWTLRLAELNQESFDQRVLDAVEKAAEFLYQMQDDHSGRVPNYGANDGALILPLNSCDYLDYRPVLNAMNYLFKHKRLYQSGPWDEDLIWFFGADAAKASVGKTERQSRSFNEGGYYTIRSGQSWAMTRCHTHRSRPAHADMLGLDLWFNGINILRDSGTYMYNCQPLWQDYFKSTAAHNCVVIDGLDQMTKGTRFMWFDWTKSKTVLFSSFDNDRIKLFQGEHYGYRRRSGNVVHRRAILSIKNYWVIVDDIVGGGEHQVRAFWHLADCDIDISGNGVVLKTEKGTVCLSVASSDKIMQCQRLKGDEQIPAGWDSLYYGQHQPAPVFVVSGKVVLPARIVTLVSLGEIAEQLRLGDDNIVSWSSAQDGQECEILLNSIEQSECSVFKGCGGGVFCQDQSGFIWKV